MDLIVEYGDLCKAENLGGKYDEAQVRLLLHSTSIAILCVPHIYCSDDYSISITRHGWTRVSSPR